MKVYWDDLIGVAVPDGVIKDYAQDHLNCEVLVIGSENLLLELRLQRLKGNLSELIVIVDGEKIQVNEYGILDKWPKNFANFAIHNCTEILRLQREKRDKNKGTP